MRVTFLGTAASRPTVGRNVPSIVIAREGELLMFDCGEGTQRQMMRFSTGFTVNDIFFTHMHADHFLGVIGLLRTMGLQGREDPIHLYAPIESRAILYEAVHLGVERVPFEIVIHELDAGERIQRAGYDVVAFKTHHGVRALGYAVVEHERLGRFHPKRAHELGVPPGPLFGKLHHGEAVEVDGRTIKPADVVGPPRPGRTVVYTGDSRPCKGTLETARDADLLIHDATFGEEESERANLTGHSTAREAAELAKKAGVLKLVLTHLSSRYADDPRALEREARHVFRETVTAHDGMQIEVPFRDANEKD